MMEKIGIILITQGQLCLAGKLSMDNWYYLDPAENNKMANSGWRLIGDNWYFFYGSGAMATNWLAVEW